METLYVHALTLLLRFWWISSATYRPGIWTKACWIIYNGSIWMQILKRCQGRRWGGGGLNLLCALIPDMWLPWTECCDMNKTWLCSPFLCSSLSYYSTLTKWIIVVFVFVSDLQKEFNPNWNDVRTKFINTEQTKTCSLLMSVEL